MTSVDIAFPIQRTTHLLARDHGYPLYAALSTAMPELHAAEWLAVHPVSGEAQGEHLQLGERSSVRLRVPPERIATVLGLVGANLEVGGCRLRLAAPTVHPLTPAASLDARLVVVKLTAIPRREHPELQRPSLDRQQIELRVRAELARQLGALEIDSAATLHGHGRFRVGGRMVLGYAVRVGGLSADQSLRLQSVGLGGKRRMGCGVFRPTRGA